MLALIILISFILAIASYLLIDEDDLPTHVIWIILILTLWIVFNT